MTKGSPFILQYAAEPSYCIGASSANHDAPVILCRQAETPEPLVQWELDPRTGLIKLAASNTNAPLVLDFPGMSPRDFSGLILSRTILGRASQRWDWSDPSGTIRNLGSPAHCIDNDGGIAIAGNKIQIWLAFPGNPNQQWRWIEAPSLAHPERTVWPTGSGGPWPGGTESPAHPSER